MRVWGRRLAMLADLTGVLGDLGYTIGGGEDEDGAIISRHNCS